MRSPPTTLPRDPSSRFPALFLSLLSLCLLVAPRPAAASDPVNFSWDRNPEPDVVGYRFYYGVASGNYGSWVDAGNETTLELSDLPDGTTFYAVVTARNSAGLESPPSNEVVFETTSENPSRPPPVAGEIVDLLIEVNANGDPVLNLTGEAGQSVTVEYSDDLAQWSTLGTLTLAEDGAGTLEAGTAARRPDQRFYRVKGE